MKRYLFIIISLVICSMVYGQDNVWEIVRIKDKFGDYTGEKRLVYSTIGTFTNSTTTNDKLEVFVFVDSPDTVDIVVYEYEQYRVFLDNDARFSCKMGNTIIENVQVGRDTIHKITYSLNDEKNNLIYLLKQGKTIKVSADLNWSTYRFDINTENFLPLLSETFNNKEIQIGYYKMIKDKKGAYIYTALTLKYKWSIDSDTIIYKTDIAKVISDFFEKQDFSIIADKKGKYQKEKTISMLGVPLLKIINDNFPSVDFEYVDFLSNLYK